MRGVFEQSRHSYKIRGYVQKYIQNVARCQRIGKAVYIRSKKRHELMAAAFEDFEAVSCSSWHHSYPPYFSSTIPFPPCISQRCTALQLRLIEPPRLLFKRYAMERYPKASKVIMPHPKLVVKNPRHLNPSSLTRTADAHPQGHTSRSSRNARSTARRSSPRGAAPGQAPSSSKARGSARVTAQFAQAASL
jgi:hypothetical protein